MTHDAVAELIGAWALDACPPDETELVEAHLGTCDTCATEAGALREAAADLGGAYLRPPATSLSRLLAAAPARRRPAAQDLPYAAQTAALDLLLSDLTPDEWRRPAFDSLTVKDVVAHLAATDSLVADALGLPASPPISSPLSPAARTEVVLSFESERSPEQTHQSWRSQADSLCRAATSHPAPSTVTVTLSRPFPLADALTARAYETWIHGEDIAAATGRPPLPPLPGHIHPMADLAARLLPRVVSRRLSSTEVIHLHLTGPGGGTWTVPLDPATVASAAVEPAATVTLDVIEFCRLAGARRTPSQLAITTEGDTALAGAFLAAVPSMAPVP
ncbi:maleylpyruvate isomerase family mycothiol-dependent enzyme [Actinoplanes sp. NPDC000266]